MYIHLFIYIYIHIHIHTYICTGPASNVSVMQGAKKPAQPMSASLQVFLFCICPCLLFQSPSFLSRLFFSYLGKPNPCRLCCMFSRGKTCSRRMQGCNTSYFVLYVCVQEEHRTSSLHHTSAMHLTFIATYCSSFGRNNIPYFYTDLHARTYT